jgi:histidine phosphotransfer protein HptB
MSELPVLDFEAIESLRSLSAEGDDSFLKEIVAIFVGDTPGRLRELRTAFAAGDQTTFSRAAHSLKGSASNLGAVRLRAVAEELERLSREGPLDGLDRHLPRVEAEFATAKAALEQL